MKHYVIIVRQWFDKANGNSYFSLRVIDTHDGLLQAIVPMTYGRGSDAFVQAAEDALRAVDPTTVIRSEQVLIDFVEVSRKRDLHTVSS